MLNRIAALIKKEFLAIWKDPRSRMIIIVPPILQLLIFANALTMEMKNIDMVVLDRSGTVESRELISEFDNSRWFRKIFYAHNEQDVRHYIETQKVQLALEINNDFASGIKRGKPVSVQLIVDGRQTNAAGIIGGYASQVVSAYSSEISPAKGASINFVVRNWFNPNLEYRWYLLCSTIAILALVTTLMLTALSIARERELGTFDQLIVSPLTPFEILAGKTVPPLIISVLLTLFMILMSIIFFKLPFKGSIFWLLISTVIALFSIVGVGLFISSLCKTQQQAILGAFTFQMPAVLLSGFISPVEDMPALVQYLTYANPVKFFMIITKGIIFKGMQPADIISNLIALLLIAFITLSAAGWMFKRKLD
ncbi:MAG: ABC transporter permease [Heliobacteriaceae bacterium]|jgi:ABC-2 type transport system permease protein|nr:ABC transporter permease [Heliobacteriaceae bacterium]